MANEDATAVNDAVQDTAVTDSAPVEEQSLEVVDEGPALDPRDFQDTESNTEDVADDTADAPAEETTPQESDTKVAPKEWDASKSSRDNFRNLVNERDQLRERLAQLESRKSQVATEQELLNEVNPETGDYFTPAEAERIARMHTLQESQKLAEQEAQTLQLQQHQYTINAEAEQVVKDFPIFREFNPDGTKNPEYSREAAIEAAEFVRDHLVFDQQGNILGSNVSPYKVHQTVARAYQASAVANQIKGQQATEKMLSQADNPTSAKPTRSSKDDKDMSPEEYARHHKLQEVW